MYDIAQRLMQENGHEHDSKTIKAAILMLLVTKMRSKEGMLQTIIDDQYDDLIQNLMYCVLDTLVDFGCNRTELKSTVEHLSIVWDRMGALAQHELDKLRRKV